jgi:uncharacterized protein (TIGR01777 family)
MDQSLRKPPSPRRIVITGATGTIGTALCRRLLERGDTLVVFSRDAPAARQTVPGAAAYVTWQPAEMGPWAEQIEEADAIVYLAGGSLYQGRQTEASVRAETESRERGIRGLVHAMAQARVTPPVFVSASSVGTYGYAGVTDAAVTESSPPGADFWGQDSVPWEGAALDAGRLGVRAAVLRLGYVLDARPGGGLMRQVEQFRRGFGGPVWPGTQWVPWIHIADAVGLFLLALDDERVRGPLNATAPGAIRNRDYARSLGAIVGRPARLPTPGFALRLGLGVVAETIISGRRVVPQAALDLGYRFRFPALEDALRDLVASPGRAPRSAAG